MIKELNGELIYSGKTEFWTEVDDIGNLIDKPWCVGGDFNEILFSSDRRDNSRLNGQTHCFHNWLSVFSLIILPLLNLHHTWSNFRENTSCSKIERFFITRGMAGENIQKPI